jgi:hypothetical protein
MRPSPVVLSSVRARPRRITAITLAVIRMTMFAGPALAQGLDPQFNATTNGTVSAVAVQSDGQILIGGWFTQVNGIPRQYLARLMPDGALDST